MIDRQLPVEFVRELTSGIGAGLGEGLVSLYLYGSSVSGGFEAEASDIDLLAVTSRDVSEIDFTNVDAFHRSFVDRHPAWNDRLEIVYVGRRTLWSFRDGGSLGVISPGESFHVRDGVELWLQNWYLVRETGVTLHGPAPDAVIPAIGWNEFTEAIARYAAEVRGRSLEEASPGARAYAVMTMCRALCTILTRRPCSKQEGAAWARERMPERSWLIGAAVECWLSRGAIGFADDETRPAAEELIRLLADEVATTTLPGILAAAIVAVGCSEAEDGSEHVSVSLDGGSVVLTSSAQGRSDVNTGFIPKGTAPAVHFSSFEWSAQGVSDLYAYGLAPTGAASVETVPAGTAKIQADGTFLAVIPNQADAPLQSIHWRFLTSDGTLLVEGDGPNN